jgi:hypothetical protein
MVKMSNPFQDAYDDAHAPMTTDDESYGYPIGVEEYMKDATDDSPLTRQVGGDHYKSFNIQPIEYIMLNNLPYIEGNIVKYISRWRAKGGIKDLEKIKHYVDMLIDFEENNGGNH